MAKKQQLTNPVPTSKLKKVKENNWDVSDESQHVDLFESVKNIKTMPDLVHALKTNEKLEIEAHVLCVHKESKKAKLKTLDKKEFTESYLKNQKKKTFKEAFDSFASSDGGGNLVGQDYVPLLGGPFNKQLYYYDYLSMHAQCFYAYNHDPIAHAAVHIIRDFVIGRGFRVDVKHSDSKTQAVAQGTWDAFAKVNELDNLVDQFCIELCIYGEQMPWWLPNNETKIGYKLQPGQEVPRGAIPRVRLIDPSVIWDICTYPEDITRKLFYQWVAPTQYQMYTGKDGDKPVSSTKFIYQQIPADQIDHYKVNSASNEKRGRSDLFPVLGFLKRLRDSVNYSIIGLQKATAWSLDTTIDGNQTDIDAYCDQQKEQPTIPPAGSEFIHSKKVERKYLGNDSASRGGQSQAFDWAFSMVCAGLGIPQQYFGTHLSGGSTRATAVVATEPVVKKFEARRRVIESFLQNSADRLFKQFGIEGCEVEVTFPELATQDRSSKLKDLIVVEQAGWCSKERAAQVAAKEFDWNTYDFNEEMKKISEEKTEAGPELAPLSRDGSIDTGGSGLDDNTITSQDKRDVVKNRGF